MRWRPRFSLRTLVVFLLLVTSGSGLWWHWEAWCITFGEDVLIATPTISPDGSRVVTCNSDDGARLRDPTTGRTVANLGPSEREHRYSSFSEDGRLLILGSTSGVARIYDAQSGQELLALGAHARRVVEVGFFRNGERAFTSSLDNKARISNAITGAQVATFETVSRYVHFRAFSPEGSFALVSLVNDHYCSLVGTESGHVLADLKDDDSYGVRQAIFSPDGTRAVIVNRTSVVVWEVPSGRKLTVLKGYGESVRGYGLLSPDGSLLAANGGDGCGRVADMATGDLVAVLKGHGAYGLSGAAFSPDGRKLATWTWGAAPGRVHVWDPRTGECLTVLEGARSYVRKATWHPDGSRIIVASDDGAARIWNVPGGECVGVLRGHQDAVAEARSFPDGERVLTVGWDGVACIWDAASAKHLATIRLQSHPPRPDYGSSPRPMPQVTIFSDGDCLHTMAEGQRIWRRRRPEWWWGVFWLWEFWLTVAFAGLFVWSVVRDRRALGKQEPGVDPGAGEG